MSICIPYADGIWNMSGPPNWGLANLTTPVIDTITSVEPAEGAIKDPRWRGSVNQSFGAGTAEDASFRAVWYETAGKRYLYFSWHVKFDSDPDTTIDRLYVVIAPSAGGGSRPLVIDIQPFTDTADHLTAEPPDAILAGRRRSVAGPNPGEEVGTSEPLGNLPDWLTDDTKVWRSGAAAAQGQWAIHMRVPVDPAATDVDGDPGLRLTTSFKMWYEFRIAEAARSSGTLTGGVLQLNVPNGVTLTNLGRSYPDPNAAGQGETYTYGAVAGINDISCPAANAISIGYLDIGTTNTPDSYIDPTNTNTFVARPWNNNNAVAVPQNAINATFRLANWGSTRLDATWTTIRSNVTNSDVIGPMSQATAANDIRFNRGNMLTDFPNVGLGVEPHQCMLVELSGAGLLFTTSSVVRNMDFDLNSKSVRPATISVEGLEPISSAPRDVYLAVETINMPAQTRRDFGQFGPIMTADVRPTNNQDPESLFNKVQQAQALVKKSFNPDRHAKPEQRLALMLDVLREVRATSDDLDRLFPTYRVHVYYDTGETWTVDGHTYPLLGLQPSFGFYAYHEGPLLGFNHQLRGAIRLANNFYLLRVPNKGSAKITTILHGISPGEEGQIERDEPIQEWPEGPGTAGSGKGCLARLLALIGIKI